MKFVEGAEVNDLKSIQKLGINPHAIARLALVLADINGIKENCLKLGAGEDLYALFAGILRMRPWIKVIDPAVNQLAIQGNASDHSELQEPFTVTSQKEKDQLGRVRLDDPSSLFLILLLTINVAVVLVGGGGGVLGNSKENQSGEEDEGILVISQAFGPTNGRNMMPLWDETLIPYVRRLLHYGFLGSLAKGKCKLSPSISLELGELV
ncbi:hypothetical protein Tco_0928614 [Tanacetum coccineum]